MTIRHFPSNEWVQQSHKARTALGEMLKLVEDRILVLNTNADMGAYHSHSQQLGEVLKKSQEALQTSSPGASTYWCCTADFGKHEEACPNGEHQEAKDPNGYAIKPLGSPND